MFVRERGTSGSLLPGRSLLHLQCYETCLRLWKPRSSPNPSCSQSQGLGRRNVQLQWYSLLCRRRNKRKCLGGGENTDETRLTLLVVQGKSGSSHSGLDIVNPPPIRWLDPILCTLGALIYNCCCYGAIFFAAKGTKNVRGLTGE